MSTEKLMDCSPRIVTFSHHTGLHVHIHLMAATESDQRTSVF
jgi:hypothetical protein